MTTEINTKPTTISEIVPFINQAVIKTLSLTPSSFGKFTSDHLPDDYFYYKWLGKNKEFTDVYLNMDPTHQALFVKYVIGEEVEEDAHLAALLNRFFLFTHNYDSDDFCENPFAGKYGAMLMKLATGKTKPSFITGMQVINCFYKCDWNGKLYLTKCALGAKKS